MGDVSPVLLAYAHRHHHRWREQFASRLHDHLGQLLTAAGFQLELVRAEGGKLPPEVSQRLQSLQNTLEEALEQARQLMYDATPRLAEKLGLQAALERLVRRLNREQKVSISTRYDRSACVEGPAASVLHWIAEEALTNALLHSGASNVWLSLRRSAGQVELIVKDNGKGFDVAATLRQSTLSGVALMHYWARDHNIALKILSPKGEGTVVSAVVAVARSSSALAERRSRAAGVSS